MRGWSVFTRPPSSSGTSVSSSTRVDVETVLGEVVRGAAARDELDAELGEAARELGEPGLVEGRRGGRARSRDQLPDGLRAAGGARRPGRAARSDSTVSSSCDRDGLGGDHCAACRRPRRRSARSPPSPARRRPARPRSGARRGTRAAGRSGCSRSGPESGRGRSGAAGACSRRRRRARRRAPASQLGHRLRLAPRGSRSPPARRPASGCPRPSARSSARHAGFVRGDGGDRQPVVDQRLQVRPLAARPGRRSRDPPDHLAGARIGRRHDGAHPDSDVEHASLLLLADSLLGQPGVDGRALPRVPVDLGGPAFGQDAREVAEDAAAR